MSLSNGSTFPSGLVNITNKTGVTLTQLQVFDSNGKAKVLGVEDTSGNVIPNVNIKNGSSFVYLVGANTTNLLFQAVATAADNTTKNYGVLMLNVNGQCQFLFLGEPSSEFTFSKTSSPASLFIEIPVTPVFASNPVAPPAGKTLPELSTFPTSIQVTNYSSTTAKIYSFSSLQPNQRADLNPLLLTSLDTNSSSTFSIGVIPIGGFYMLAGFNESPLSVMGVILYNHKGKVMKFYILGNNIIGLSVPNNYSAPYMNFHSNVFPFSIK